ncbi:sugar transferase [Sporolactobacillus sp. THM19-2]|uniref:sugar transferase n=1 Tax=Sporolactobacillus sp. THM19-2 TaxID=2511171 RepID=UPI0010203DF4|nr:sugar transferase [Sporolactobacillus sp. THM19-2]RYL93960.1 sugar transferase [Sporolactobacillus sp. THM19-2]
MAISRTEFEGRFVEQAEYLGTGKSLVHDSSLYLFAKRCMDFFGALTGLILFSPLFLILALAIKIEDPAGHVFFKQLRVGRNGKKFKIYKFRSMVSNAEQMLDKILSRNETEGCMFKMKDDPRVTKIGHFIRKTSLDELPQLINVLKGDMSLVGPRPPLPREVKQYTRRDLQRLLVTPGCTGMWQVNGRSSVGFHEMVELDLKYIKERNLRLDIKIILKTFIVLFTGRGAY